MRNHRPCLIAVILTVMLGGCETPSANVPPAAAAPAAPEAAGAQAPKAALSGPEASLRKGMTAAEVRKIMGAPREIKPMPSPSGTAEVWVYVRSSSHTGDLVQVGQRMVQVTQQVADGRLVTSQVPGDPIIMQEVKNEEETISLLMFDGAFVTLKRSVAHSKDYQ